MDPRYLSHEDKSQNGEPPPPGLESAETILKLSNSTSNTQFMAGVKDVDTPSLQRAKPTIQANHAPTHFFKNRRSKLFMMEHNRLIGPAQVAMEILNNGACQHNMKNLSMSPHLEQNIDERVKVPQDNSLKKLKNADDGLVEEKMFPAGIIANLEKDIKKPPVGFYIGLEYVIEIQHNTMKDMEDEYACLLCDEKIKAKCSDGTTITRMKKHLKSSVHKLKYLDAYFPKITKAALINRKPIDHELTNSIIEKICLRYGKMKVKVVIGMKLYKRKKAEIKSSIDRSTHFREDDSFIGVISRSSTSTSKNIEIADELSNGIWMSLSENISDKGTSTAIEISDTSLQSKKFNSRPGSQNVKPDTLTSSRHFSVDEERHKRDQSPRSSTRKSKSLLNGDKIRNPHDYQKPHGSSSTEKSKETKSQFPSGKLLPSHSRSRSRSPCLGRITTKEIHSKNDRYYKDKTHYATSADETKCNLRSQIPSTKPLQQERKHSYLQSSTRIGGWREYEKEKRISPCSDPNTRVCRKIEKKYRSPSPSHLHRRAKATEGEIEAFLYDERLLMEKMDSDKKMYMTSPEKHPDYDREWEKFYTYKCNQYGPMHSSYLQEDWAAVWKDYFISAHQTLVRQERNILLNKHKIYYSDLERHQEKKILRSKMSSGRKSNEGLQMTNSIMPSTSDECGNMETSKPTLINIDSLINTPNPGPLIMKDSETEEAGKMASVLQTLRLLYAIEDDLEHLGSAINTYFMRVSAAEQQNRGHKDNSALLLNDSQFLVFLKSCKEILQNKLSFTSYGLSKNKERAFLTSIQHINKLLETSLLLDCSSKEKNLRNSYEAMIKSKIENKVIEEFNKAGRSLDQDEKIRLVNAEYQRIVPELSEELSKPMFSQAGSSSRNVDHGNLTHLSLGLSKKCLDTHNSGHYNQKPSNDTASVKKDNLLVKDINWKEIQKVMQTVSKKSSNTRKMQQNLHCASVNASNSNMIIEENDIEIIDDDVIVLDEVKQDDIVCLDDLNFNDLVELCTNIKKLDNNTQGNLIKYMKKLEKTNPLKVQELKKCINIL